MPHAALKLTLVLPLMLVIALIGCARVTPPPTPIPIRLPDDSQTRIQITPGSAPQVYRFSGARLKLDSQTDGFAFNAEIHDASGQTVASFSRLLDSVQITLAPATDYQIALAAADPRAAGTLALALGSAVIAPETLDGTALQAPNCRVTNASGANALVRSAPAAQYAVLGLLTTDGSLPVIGRTDNDWYTVDFAERQGWISGGVVALSGDCNAIPRVRNPAIPSAPADAPAFLLQVDRDASGSFHDAISAPDGDTNDLIWVRIINLDTHPPNNYREFALTLDCRGVGVDSVRWGSAYDANLRCGDSVVLPFLSGSAQQPISVQFPPGSSQSYVEYTLSLLPANAVG